MSFGMDAYQPSHPFVVVVVVVVVVVFWWMGGKQGMVLDG